MTLIEQFAPENALSIVEAKEMKDAMLAALEAMAYFGSAVKDMEVVASLLVVATREGAEAFKRYENGQKVGAAS